MKPFYHDDWLTVYEGDTVQVMGTLPSGSVHTVITSPPYYGLRDYGLPPSTWSDGWVGCLGLESTPEQYVDHLVEVGRQIYRVLRDDGTFWLNIGDSYAGSGRGGNPPGSPWAGFLGSIERENASKTGKASVPPGLKKKDLIGIPWMTAFALRAAGWYLRSDIIWSKPNVMPESVNDRPTKAHEYVFLLSKKPTYYYDDEAIKEDLISTPEQYLRAGKSVRDNHEYGAVGGRPLGEKSFATMPSGRNKRTVWHIAPQPYAGAHYAPFPPKLIEPMILAGTSEDGVCPGCGAQRVRVTRKETAYHHVTTDIGKQSGSPYEGQTGAGAGTHDVRHGVFSASETVGWTSGCEHDRADNLPAIVLDPFAGSGTTGLVAQRLSRRAVLIDLNGEYVRQQLVRNAHVPLGL